MSEFTKGKWKIYHNDYYDVFSVVAEDTVCDMHYISEETHDRIPYDNAEANARLIVACCSEGRALKLAEKIIAIEERLKKIMRTSGYENTPLPGWDELVILAHEIVKAAKEGI